MESYIDKNSDTSYYQPPSNVSAWQGICPTDDPKKFLLTGTQAGGVGAIYKGPINIANSNNILAMEYPKSTLTSVYGPEFTKKKYSFVGSYQTGTPGIDYPCKGFGYVGKYNDFSNEKNYFTIEPDTPYDFTVVHSTRGGLAVYISSNESQLNFIVGKSFIFNIDTKKTITEVLYPNSLYTTTYGIWYNGITGCTRSYTISGGFSLTGPLDTRTFVVDFLYNCKTKTYVFKNWTEIKIPGISIYTHAQGITKVNKYEYILPVANYYIDLLNPGKFAKLSGGKIRIRRTKDGFKLFSYQSINFPQSLLTVVTSAAKDSVCGVFENSNNDAGAFQAITK